MPRDSLGKTLCVALILCVVCSVLVSAAAVILRPRQETNRRREVTRNILLAAGLLDDPHAPAGTVEKLAERIEKTLVDLETGEEVDPAALGLPSVEAYDQRKAAADPEMSVPLPADEAIHGIRRRERYAVVYRVEKEGRKLIVLPIYGKGLWSTLYGFLALDPDTRTIRGLTFHEHAETPGLGGEVDNPAWKAQWPGKPAFDDDGNFQIEITKPGRASGPTEVDGLAGATITTRGVENLLRFWLGENGFGPYLARQRAERSETRTADSR